MRNASLRFFLYKWYQTGVAIKSDKSAKVITKVLRKHSNKSKEKKIAQEFMRKLSGLLSVNMKMNLMSFIHKLQNHKNSTENTNNFLNKIKEYYKFRTLHLLCHTSVCNNKFIRMFWQLGKKYSNHSLKSYFEKWKKCGTTSETSNKLALTSEVNPNYAPLRKIFRKSIIKSLQETAKSVDETLKTIDLIFTIENKVKTNCRGNVFGLLSSINSPRVESDRNKLFLGELYKEMNASYVKTLQELENLDEDFEDETTFESDEEVVEKMKFKYNKSKKMQVKKEPWWEENEIRSFNVNDL